jgi:16S rRNA C967 or C1407 C5-methylase (RsmB/RsmF family)
MSSKKRKSAKSPKEQAEKFIQKLIAEPQRQLDILDQLFKDCEQPSLLCLHTTPSALPFPTRDPLPLQPDFVARPETKTDSTKSELHDNGSFYVMDFSSVLECAPLLSIPIQSPIVLDLCAAPGGKSLFAWKALTPRLLLANEVTQARLKMLISNIKRCQVTPVKILSQAPQKLIERLQDSCDVVLVDAPCTGQSLVAKKQSAPGAFFSHQININAMRQRGILSSASEIVRAGGYILYTTCTFSKEENEGLIEWFLKKNENFEAVFVKSLESFQSEFTEKHAYRFWPNTGQGAGGFTCLLKKDGEFEVNTQDFSELPSVWSSL